MKSGKRKAQMRKEKVETRNNYCHKNCSVDVVTEILSQLQMFNRNQLEKLICLLSQEIVRLEHKLQYHTLCSVSTDGQSGHSDCKTIIHGESESRHSRATCTVLQRLVQSVSHFKTLKPEESIQQQDHAKVKQLATTNNHSADLKSESVGDEYENNIEHIQLPSQQRNIECSPFTGSHQNPMKMQIVSNDSFLEDKMSLKTRKLHRRKELNNSREIPLNEKMSNLTFEERKKSLRNNKNKPVSLEHQHQIPSVSNSVHSFKDSESGKQLISEKESVQHRPDVTHQQCANKLVPDENVQPLGKSNKYKVPKWLTSHSVTPAEASSAEHVLEIASETRPENGLFICCFCQFSFQSKLVLTDHMKTVHRCTQYPCIVCGKSFRHKHLLKAHHRGSHTGATVLCSHCGKLVLQARLDMHMEKVHERPSYTCHICQKGFLKRECLEGHIHKHNNTKPYICEHCGRKYAYSTSLSSHRKQCVRASMPPHLQHPRSTDNKCTTCVCEICGLKFEGVSGLKDHLGAKHSNKVQHCGFCGKTFQWRPSYNRHIKKCVDRTDLERVRYKWLQSQKTVNKHYVCVCGKHYLYRQSFRRHERSCHQKLEVESSVASSVNRGMREAVIRN
ncbi:hypothetical protein BsWGS_13375 [Bradybaena similaris]